MQSRDTLFEAFIAILVGTAKRFLYRRHLELWDRDAAALSALPEKKRWIEIVKLIDQLLWQLPAYDPAELEDWEKELKRSKLPSLIGLHIRWNKDYQRLLKTAKIQGSYDVVFVKFMLAEFPAISIVERAFLIRFTPFLSGPTPWPLSTRRCAARDEISRGARLP